jgi:hypothetical protein
MDRASPDLIQYIHARPRVEPHHRCGESASGPDRILAALDRWIGLAGRIDLAGINDRRR